MFKSAGVLSSLGTEMATGQFEIAVAEMALLGAIIGFKKIKSNVQERRERKHQQQDAQRAEEQRRQDEYDAEIRRQQEEQKQEEIRRQQQEQLEEQKKQEEIQRQIDEQNAQERARQEELNQARLRENQQDIERADLYAQREIDQQEADREQRIRNRVYMLSGEDARIRRVQGYPGQSDLPWVANYLFPQSMLQNDREPDEEWYQIENDDYQPPDENPDENPDDRPPNGGGGGGYPNPNPGGNGDPNPNPGGNNPYRRNYNVNVGRRNPFADLLQDISRQIAKEKNSEKESVNKQIEEDQQQKIIGGDPATWTPTNLQPEDNQEQNYPGKNGAGTYKGNTSELTKEDIKKSILDNQHLTQQEIEALLMAQGIQEMTAEDQLALLADLDKKISQQLNNQVKIAGSVLSSQIRRF